jgi:aryl-alcohol dehydrogenase-like predicted oxidoreductase
MMEYRPLGSTGVDVSVLSLGTLTFGGDNGAKGLDVADARRLLDTALAAGVNLIDTADVYSDGEAETILGQAMSGRRDRIILATKVGFSTSLGVGLSREHIARSIDASLNRLGVDHIDLYQLHGWDGSVPLDETFGALGDAIDQGKIRFAGCSNFSARQLYRAWLAAGESGVPPLVSQQIYYSLLGREAEAELIPTAADLGMSSLIWSPLAGGLLTGKYRRDQPWPRGSRHMSAWTEPPVHDWNRTYDVIESLVAAALELKQTPARLALAALMRTPTVTSVIVGARSVAQLEDTLATTDLTLPDEVVSDLLDIGAVPLPYPFWHQVKSIAARANQVDRIPFGLSARE